MAADDAKNLATEKVSGEAWLSTENRVRSTRGVESVKIGLMREVNTVGKARAELHR